jgi:predicted Rossmann-fold nucleotide-binding protein
MRTRPMAVMTERATMWIDAMVAMAEAIRANTSPTASAISAELASGSASMARHSEAIVSAAGGIGTRVRAMVGTMRINIVGVMTAWVEPGVVEITADDGRRHRARIADAHGTVIDSIEVAS